MLNVADRNVEHYRGSNKDEVYLYVKATDEDRVE